MAATDQVGALEVGTELREALLAAGYADVEIRREWAVDRRLDGSNFDMELLFLTASFPEGAEPNFDNGLSKISRRYGYDGMGTARDGYHRVLIGM